MIWRTCGSLSDSSARSAYSTRAVGFVAPAETRPRYCGVSASSRSSRRPRASFVAVPREGIRSPRMRREIVEWSTPDCWASCRWDIFLALSWARSHSLNPRPSGRRRREGLQVPCAVQPGTAAQRREHVRDAAEHDDRQDADRPVDERDRRRHLDRQPVRGGHDADDAELDDAEAGRAERHRGEERADEGDEERPADPEVDARDAKGLDDEEQAQRLGGPDEAGDHDERREGPPTPRTQNARC